MNGRPAACSRSAFLASASGIDFAAPAGVNPLKPIVDFRLPRRPQVERRFHAGLRAAQGATDSERDEPVARRWDLQGVARADLQQHLRAVGPGRGNPRQPRPGRRDDGLDLTVVIPESHDHARPPMEFRERPREADRHRDPAR